MIQRRTITTFPAAAFVLLALIVGTMAMANNGLVAWYDFETPNLGTDGSTHGQVATVGKATSCEGRVGDGIALSGDGGLEVPGSELLQTNAGFALELWARFDSVSSNMNIISKDGEYLLRVDPPVEGGNISFFVNVNGSLEPRVRGTAAQPDTWYHIIATWDGQLASLWVNGRQFESKRAGSIKAAGSPVLIGTPSKWGPAGLQGTIDEVRLYNEAMTAGEVLRAEYALDQPGKAVLRDSARFEFAAGLEGWEARHTDELAVTDGRLVGITRGHGAVLLNRSLNVPLRGERFVSCRMSVTAGGTGRLVFLTSAGPGAVSFPVIADGAPHSYVLAVDELPEWSGTLTALGLAPSDQDARVSIEFVRVSEAPEGPPELTVRSLLPDMVMNRAGRQCPVRATVHNTGGPGANLTAALDAPDGVTIVGGGAQALARIDHGETVDLVWPVQANSAMAADLRVIITGEQMATATASLPMAFTPAVNLPPAEYVPEPQVVSTGDLLVGAHYCPLWMQGSRSSGWELIEPFPKRKPALGWYDEDNPEVTDWEIKQALEHGISYFVYCWYRANQGGPVEMFLPHAIHEGLFNARYESKFKWCIMWENQSKGRAGVASEEDLLENLMPFWIENYFKRPSYLKVDNKPVLFIYRPEYLVNDLGSVENVRSALKKMRRACREAGFDGLTILGEYRGTQPGPLQLMADEGVDYTFAYCWPVGGDPEPDEAIRAQEEFWQKTEDMGIIPQVLTLTMGWDSTPWHPSFSKWRLPPADFKTLCERGKAMAQSLPAGSLGRKLVLLDNWNEFGEGHYIAPHRQYGFGYLDAVRDVFSDAPKKHTDIVPEDVGLGPYDSRYAAYRERIETCGKRVVAEEGLEPGLVAWWTFDEPDDTGWAWDYSGNRHGGYLNDATRAPGIHGKALSCSGGSVTVPANDIPYPTRAITIECWIKTELAGQSDKWFVSHLFSAGTSGFRLGLSGGKLSWAIAKSPWSHHLVASEPVPVEAWVHVAATYDGQTMRLYMNGKKVGSLERGGRIYNNDHPVVLGSYEAGHRAFFTGLLDDVRMFARALTPEEIQHRAAQ